MKASGNDMIQTIMCCPSPATVLPGVAAACVPPAPPAPSPICQGQSQLPSVKSSGEWEPVTAAHAVIWQELVLIRRWVPHLEDEKEASGLCNPLISVTVQSGYVSSKS